MASTLQHETHVAVALERATGWSRLRGLIGRPPPPPGSGLLFENCRAVHGCFMRHPIDVVFVDDDGRVLRVALLRPWRALRCRAAHHTIELRAGEAAVLGLGPGATVKKKFAKGG